MKTTLLRGGKIVDGTGGQARDGHVLIGGDRIKALLRAGEALPAADSVIDATGCVVAPGFIDAHSHMDWSLPLDDHPQHAEVLPGAGRDNGSGRQLRFLAGTCRGRHLSPAGRRVSAPL